MRYAYNMATKRPENTGVKWHDVALDADTGLVNEEVLCTCTVPLLHRSL